MGRLGRRGGVPSGAAARSERARRRGQRSARRRREERSVRRRSVRRRSEDRSGAQPRRVRRRSEERSVRRRAGAAARASAAARTSAARRALRAAGAAARTRALPGRPTGSADCCAGRRWLAAGVARHTRAAALAPGGAVAAACSVRAAGSAVLRRCASRSFEQGSRAAHARRERGHFADGGGDVALVGARPIAPPAAADARRRGLCLPSHWQQVRRAVGHPRAAGFARLRRPGPPRVRAFRDSGGGRRAGGARHPAGSLARGAGAALVCRG